MSDTSLYSSLYEQVLEYAALVDDVLVSIKDDTSSPNDVSRQKLAKFLTIFASDQWDELPSRLVALMLSEKSGFAQKDWARVSTALLSNETDDFLVESLEHLAKSLQHKHAETATRMGVWPR